MNNNKNIVSALRLLSIIFFLLFGVSSLKAQQLLSAKKASSVASEVERASNYKNWQTASWSGKVKADMLPVSVTAKTFLRRDSLTMISLRAPLFGEVARIEIDKYSLLVVNKMKKLYWRLTFADVKDYVTTLHTNLQDILLGRVTVINSGTLSKYNVKDGDMYKVDDSTYLISFIIAVNDTDVNYGYAFDKQGRILELLASQGKPHTESAPQGMESELITISKSLSVEVNYGNNSTDAALTAQIGNRKISASLQNVELEWGVKGFDRLNVSKGYKACTTINELLKF